jgi:hypothetical protein
MNEQARPATKLLSASCPGGQARQFRVQVASPETASLWQLAGSFRDAGRALAYANDLVRSGRVTRIVCCGALPTAA